MADRESCRTDDTFIYVRNLTVTNVSIPNILVLACCESIVIEITENQFISLVLASPKLKYLSKIVYQWVLLLY